MNNRPRTPCFSLSSQKDHCNRSWLLRAATKTGGNGDPDDHPDTRGRNRSRKLDVRAYNVSMLHRIFKKPCEATRASFVAAMVERWGHAHRCTFIADPDIQQLCIRVYAQKVLLECTHTDLETGTDIDVETKTETDIDIETDTDIDTNTDTVTDLESAPRPESGIQTSTSIYEAELDVIVEVLNAYSIGPQFLEYLKFDPAVPDHILPDDAQLSHQGFVLIPLNIPCADGGRCREWML